MNNPTHSNTIRRPAIGLLLESARHLYQSMIWPGVADVARERGYDYFCFLGGSLKRSPLFEYELQRNIVYSFVNTSMIDALVIAGTIRNFVSTEEFSSFLDRFKGIPIVTIIPTLESVPGVLVDNSGGMKAVVSHLVKFHQYRRFAFVSGPPANFEALLRLKLFKEVLHENGMPVDDELIVPGDFTFETGRAEVALLIQRGKRFDALVAVNDHAALGAIAALQEHGIRVPEDVAVTGFDDSEEGKFTTPPLTSVNQPIYEMARKAAEAVIDMREGRQVPLRIELQTHLVVRQSCGCFINPQKRFCVRGAPFSPEAFADDVTRTHFKDHITGQLHALFSDVPEISSRPSLISGLVETFVDEIAGARENVFLPAINAIARAMALAGADALQWQESLAVLRRSVVDGVSGMHLDIMEDLLHDAYMVLSETATRVQAYKRILSDRQSVQLRGISQSLATSFDLDHLLEVISTELPSAGITHCYVCLYEKDSPDTIPRARLVLGVRDGKRIALDSEVIFPARDLIPRELLPGGEFQFIIEALFYKEEQLGYALFSRASNVGEIYELLREHISGALKGALLMKQVREQALALEKTNRQIQMLREQEHTYLEAIRHELELGREIQEGFLPSELPQVPGWQIYASFMPAREVSGDFYDAFVLGDRRVVLVIADVSGKDVSAALFMALIRTLIRAFAEKAIEGAADPLDAVEMTNRYIIVHHQGSKSPYMYVTLFLAVLDSAHNRITYINAGHNQPALIDGNGKVKRWLDPSGPAIGIMLGASFTRRECPFENGDTLFMYTDGVTEARNPRGDLLTHEKLAELLEVRALSAEALVHSIETAVKEHGAGSAPFDDVTMLAVRRT